MIKFNEKLKTNAALAIAVTSVAVSGIGLSVVNNNLNKQAELNNQLNKQLTTFTETLDKSNKSLEKAKKELDEANKKINEVEGKVNKNSSDIKKLLAANLEKKQSETGVSVSRSLSTRNGMPITLKLSFYGGGAEENGGYAGIDASGNKLVAGTVASNVYPMGTKFMWNGQVFTVRDRGGSHFDDYNRLDVFVPRRSGETKDQYDRRISTYGRQTVKAIKF